MVSLGLKKGLKKGRGQKSSEKGDILLFQELKKGN
jgi:hypothetical protein